MADATKRQGNRRRGRFAPREITKRRLVIIPSLPGVPVTAECQRCKPTRMPHGRVPAIFSRPAVTQPILLWPDPSRLRPERAKSPFPPPGSSNRTVRCPARKAMCTRTTAAIKKNKKHAAVDVRTARYHPPFFRHVAREWPAARLSAAQVLARPTEQPTGHNLQICDGRSSMKPSAGEMPARKVKPLGVPASSDVVDWEYGAPQSFSRSTVQRSLHGIFLR